MLPMVSLSAGIVTEGTAIEFLVTLSETSFDDVTVEYRAVQNGTAFVEDDDASDNGTFLLTIPAGSTTGTISYNTDFFSTDGTANAGQDYQFTQGQVTFEPGQTVASVAVNLIGDAIAELPEAFSLVVTPTAPMLN